MYPNNPLMMGQANFNPYLNQVSMNPVIPNYQPITQQAPRMQIDTVNGKESAYAYNIGPNSSVILADAMNPKIWMVTTDSSGYKVVKGFKIVPDDEESIINPTAANEELESKLDSIASRLDKLEERINNYGQSNSKSSWQNKSGNGNAQSNDRNNQSIKGSNDGN